MPCRLLITPLTSHQVPPSTTSRHQPRFQTHHDYTTMGPFFDNNRTITFTSTPTPLIIKKSSVVHGVTYSWHKCGPPHPEQTKTTPIRPTNRAKKRKRKHHKIMGSKVIIPTILTIRLSSSQKPTPRPRLLVMFSPSYSSSFWWSSAYCIPMSMKMVVRLLSAQATAASTGDSILWPWGQWSPPGVPEFLSFGLSTRARASPVFCLVSSCRLMCPYHSI